MTKYSDWIIWNGGECPEEPDTLVQVQRAHQSRTVALALGHEVKAHCFSWTHCGSDTDIIAYRTVFEPKVETFKGMCRARYVIPKTHGTEELRHFGVGGEIIGAFTVTTTDGRPTRVVWEASE